MSGDEPRPGVRAVPGVRRTTTTAIKRRAGVVQKLMMGLDIPTIAKDLKITEGHVRRIAREPTIQAQLKALDDEATRAIARRAAAFGPSALTVLAQIMAGKAEPAGARVSAAKNVIDVMLRATELAQLAERIDALEQRLGGPPAWKPRAT